VAWRDRALDDAASVQRTRDKVIDRVERIVAECRELYYEAGQDFTIQELSQRAGISLQTFYRYFRSKDEVLLAVLEDVIREGSAKVAAKADRARTPLRRLEILITTPLLSTGPDMPVLGRLVVADHVRLEQKFPEQVEEAIRGYLDPLIEHIGSAVKSGDLCPRANVVRDARMIATLVAGTYHRLTMGVNGNEREAVARDLWAFCYGALNTPANAFATRKPRA
jgi:TetR/AcrR family transcriptional regulator